MANAMIGSLRVSLGLDSAQFQAGLKSAQSSMERLGKQIAGAMAGVAASAGVAAAAIQSAAGRATELKRFADVAGAGYEEFQRFAHGAKSVGFESDKLADIYKDVNDKVGDFIQTGAGPMADFFENIAPQVGLTAKEFAKLSGPQALQAYYNALEKAGLSQAEMTFYMEAIASDATMLIPLLRKNGAEFSRLGDQAEALGLIMSDKTAAGAKRFRENIRVLGLSMQGLWNSVLNRVIGGMEMLSARFVAVSSSGGGLRSAVDAIAWGMNALVRAIGFVFDNLDILYDLFKVFVATKVTGFVFQAGSSFIRLARAIRVAGLATVLFSKVVRTKIAVLAVLSAVVLKQLDMYDDLVAKIKKMTEALMEVLPDEVIEGAKKASEAFKTLGKDIDNASLSELTIQRNLSVASSFGAVAKAAEQMSKDAASVFERTRTPLERYRQEITRLGTLLDAGKISQDTYNRAVLQAQDAFDQAEAAGRRSGTVFGQISDTISSSFGNAFNGLIDGSRRAQDVLRDLLGQLSQMFANRAFMALFGGASGGGGLLASLFGGGGGSSLFAGWFAKGGRIPSGQWGVAGEAGAEIVTGPAKVWTPDMLASVGARAPAGGGGRSQVVVSLAPGLRGEILADARDQSVQIVQAYDAGPARATARQAAGDALRRSTKTEFRR